MMRPSYLGAGALVVSIAACGPVSAGSSSGSDSGEPMIDPSSCAIEAEPACADCFLLLAAFDHYTAAVDSFCAFDGATKVSFEPPDGGSADVAVTADGLGVAVNLPWHSSEMRYYLYEDGAWDQGQPIGFDGTLDSLAADGRCVHALYDDGDARRHAMFDGASWHAGEALPSVAVGALGDLVARDGELVYVFVDESNTLTALARTTEWQAPQALGVVAEESQPRIAALGPDADLMVVHRGRYTTRQAGEWAPLADIPGPGPIVRASVAGLRDGRAVVTWWQGFDGDRNYYSLYDPVAQTWTPPTDYGGPDASPGTVVAGAAGEQFFLAYTHDGTAGDTTILFRVDGQEVERLETMIYDYIVHLAGNP